MKITVYRSDFPEKKAIKATPVSVHPCLKTASHVSPWSDGFTVSEVTTGAHLGSGETRAEAIDSARRRLAGKTNDQIISALGKSLNMASDVEEFIAFEHNRRRRA